MPQFPYSPAPNMTLSADGWPGYMRRELQRLARTLPGPVVLPESTREDVSGAKTLDLSIADTQRVRLIGNATLTLATSAATGTRCVVELKQDATGSRTVAWVNVTWPGGVAPTLTTTGNKVDRFEFERSDSTWYGRTLGLNY